MTDSHHNRGITLYNCWWIAIDSDLMEQRAKVGGAIWLGNGHDVRIAFGKNIYIPQHHVSSPEEALKVISLYREIASKFPGIECLFRGQTRDYFTEDKKLTVEPVAYRSLASTHKFMFDNSTKKELLRWTKRLGDFLLIKIGDHECTFFEVEKEKNRTDVTFYLEHSVGGRLFVNHLLMCVAMHYGFPTDCLDVTPLPEVAMWFALHKAHVNSSGVITFRGIEAATASQNPNDVNVNMTLPSLYIFLQRNEIESPIVDLTQITTLKGMAKRPLAQHASALPFMTYGAMRSPSMDHFLWSTRRPTPRWPTAVIKLRFGSSELIKHFPHLNQNYLFPSDDPLYVRLCEQNMPHLAIYSE